MRRPGNNLTGEAKVMSTEMRIVAKSLIHRGARQIALNFPYNTRVRDHLKKLDGVKWTRTHKGGSYSSGSAQKVLKRSVKAAGIDRNITLHTLRHSYATHLLESGVGLRYIQEILGHSNPKTTMLYTHISGKRLGEVRSPIEDLNI